MENIKTVDFSIYMKEVAPKSTFSCVIYRYYDLRMFRKTELERMFGKGWEMGPKVTFGST